MAPNINNRRALMGTNNILELQEHFYKNTVSSIVEIIDNSIQANTKNIDVSELSMGSYFIKIQTILW